MEQQSADSLSGPPKNLLVNVPRKVGSSAWGIPRRSDSFLASSDVSLFSSSLPVLPHEKLDFDSELCHSDGADLSNELDSKTDIKDSLGEVEIDAIGNLLPDDDAIGNLLPDDDAIGNLLPDDDELFSGLMDDFDLSGLPSQVEDLEEYDLFGSGGGMELDFEPQENLGIGMSKLNLSDNVSASMVSHYALPNGVGTTAGEHPYGEHPSRTLFVRNINSNVEDAELRSLFEQYGDIRTLYTACKHRGFVMISYYDIRAARTAMRGLQNKPLRRRKLDIHFSIPKDNPSEKDINQGTLVVFNLDASVSNDDLRRIFGAYGEVKEIRETPHKRHHKFIEFYDVRAAEAALRALNRSDIAGKRIKLEPSRPGGARRNLMQQLSQEMDQDDARTFRHQVGSPVTNSPPGNWSHIGSPVEHNSFSKSPGLGSLSPINSSHLSGLASILPPNLSNSPRIAPIGKDQGRPNHVNQVFTNSTLMQGTAYHHHQSFPDNKFSSNAGSTSSVTDLNSNSSSIGTLSGPQFLWGSPTPYAERPNSSAWPTPSAGQPFTSNGQGQGFPYVRHHGSLLGSHHHHVGSAPSGVPLDRPFGYFPESPETSFMSPGALGNTSLNRHNSNFMNLSTRAAMTGGLGLPTNMVENGSPNFRMMSLPRQGPVYYGNGSFPGSGVVGTDGLLERGRSRRVENVGNQIESKKQYQLDLDKIVSGEDARTTLMIKNIPNKYTSKMLLAAIDENHRGAYDFLYLPIDFKNKCNVGYAFINMVSPSHIIPFYEAFNGKKWEKFNSEKVASLAYARIQGKTALVTHFQNSSLMNEDKRCRPILFRSEGQEIGDQDILLSSNLNICIRQPDGSYSGDSLDSPKGHPDEKPEN